MSGLPFVDVKRIVVVHMKPLVTPAKVRTDKPTPFDASAVPMIQVFRSPGSESQHTSNARVDLHYFATTEDALWALVKVGHTAIHQLSGRVIDGHRFDTVKTIQDPSDLPWSASVLRAVAVYETPVRPA